MLNQLIALAYGWHSDLRWPLLAVALVVIARCAWLWLGRGARRPFDRWLLLAFAGLMTAQGVLGLIVLIGFGLLGGGFPLPRILHGVLTGLAIYASFMFLQWDGAPGKVQARNTALAVGGALACAFIGMLLLPGGLARVVA
jgi:hypothetical protein